MIHSCCMESRHPAGCTGVLAVQFFTWFILYHSLSGCQLCNQCTVYECAHWSSQYFVNIVHQCVTG